MGRHGFLIYKSYVLNPKHNDEYTFFRQINKKMNFLNFLPCILYVEYDFFTSLTHIKSVV